MRYLCVLAAAGWLGCATAHAAALALVMAIDVSDSVTADSYILQRDGIAAAFNDPRVAEAVAAAPGGIEALVLEWSDPDKIAVTVGWTQILDQRSAARFAAAVHATIRSSRGLTAIGPALAASAAQFDHLPQPAARQRYRYLRRWHRQPWRDAAAGTGSACQRRYHDQRARNIHRRPLARRLLSPQCGWRARGICGHGTRLSRLRRRDAPKARGRGGRRWADRRSLRCSRCGSARSR